MSEHPEHQERVEAAALDRAGAVAEDAEGQRPEPGLGAGPESTGHPAVDNALRSLEHLDGRPVDEHVALFEAAHETLRAALAEAGDRPGGHAGS